MSATVLNSMEKFPLPFVRSHTISSLRLVLVGVTIDRPWVGSTPALVGISWGA
jgi:hypothetical protein